MPFKDLLEKSKGKIVLTSGVISAALGLFICFVFNLQIEDSLAGNLLGSNLTLGGTLIAVLTILLALRSEAGSFSKPVYTKFVEIVLSITVVSFIIVLLAFIYLGMCAPNTACPPQKMVIGQIVAAAFATLPIMSIVATVQTVLYILEKP